jgi:hypothetical protein
MNVQASEDIIPCRLTAPHPCCLPLLTLELSAIAKHGHGLGVIITEQACPAERQLARGALGCAPSSSGELKTVRLHTCDGSTVGSAVRTTSSAKGLPLLLGTWPLTPPPVAGPRGGALPMDQA